MDSGFTSLIIDTPFVIPVLGLIGFVCLYSLLILLGWLIVAAIVIPLNAPSPSANQGQDPTGGQGSAVTSVNVFIVQAYMPGFGLLSSSYSVVLTQFAVKCPVLSNLRLGSPMCSPAFKRSPRSSSSSSSWPRCWRLRRSPCSRLVGNWERKWQRFTR